MKKIDLHIHTIATPRDSAFTFSLEELRRYVSTARLDAVAITNHDIFDAAQFRVITEALAVPVFPGIEATVDSSHVLVIGDPSAVEVFDSACQRVSAATSASVDGISIEQLEAAFGELAHYLVIPHSDKGPAPTGETWTKILRYASAGEVDSAKKFIRAIKDSAKPTPVLFSDARISTDMDALPTRHTFVDCGELTFNAIKTCLQDKGKVALSQSHGNKLFQVLANGQQLSTGLNVLLGERSSGKTYTLDSISAVHADVKYIRQFSLVQQDDEADRREFDKGVHRQRSCLTEEHLSDFKRVLDEVMAIDLRANDRAVEQYVASLLKTAEEIDRQDAFSRAALFNAVAFAVPKGEVLKDLIGSVRQVIENLEYRTVIDKHVSRVSLQALACELIELYWARERLRQKTLLVNALIQDIRASLRMRTAATPLEDVDLYRVEMDKKTVERFAQIVKSLQREAVISEESIQGFRIVAQQQPYSSAGEIKAASGVRTGFREAFAKYADPYQYLQALLTNDALPRAELYKLFTNVTYRVLNKDGADVSGGERSEFRLLQEIKDAQSYQMLLIDEPESSFDNMFLNTELNKLLKEMSETMPVIVVTHNNSVGASVGADYLLVARKEREDGGVAYRVYSGYPTDRTLSSVDGKTINSYGIVMNALEAGAASYGVRRTVYEALKD